MKILKESKYEYLKRGATRNRNLVLLSLLACLILFLLGSIYEFLYLGVLFSFFVAIYAFGQYRNWKKGMAGEKQVSKTLRELDDSYYLLDDVKLSNHGNIDHIVLGPNAIFAIETKNYGGKVTCEEDDWRSLRQQIGSPSKQVKRNALELKKFIERHTSIRKFENVWVNGIVVFPNPDVELDLNRSTVPALRLSQLCNFVKNTTGYRFSDKELKILGDVILKHSR